MAIGFNLFTKFGGIRSMAGKTDEAPSTIQGWKRRRRIPAGKQPKVLRIGNMLGLGLTAEDVLFPFPEDRPPEMVPPPRPESHPDGLEPAR